MEDKAEGLVDGIDVGNERNRAGEKDFQMLAKYKDRLDSNSWLQILTGLSSLVRLQKTEIFYLATVIIMSKTYSEQEFWELDMDQRKKRS